MCSSDLNCPFNLINAQAAQLAYSRADNAETGRSLLAPYASSLGKLEVVPAGPLFRLYGGPFASRADAARAAASLPEAAGVKPIVIQR